VTVWVADDPYAVGLWLVVLHGRAEADRASGLVLQVVDLDVEMRLHLLVAGLLWPDLRRVVGLQLEAETGAVVVRVLEPGSLVVISQPSRSR
jgi:hypothetical protein